MHIHFIGIGGIGVSALAQYYLAKGHKVSGSDLVSSEITDYLKNLGIKIKIGKHKAENLPRNVDLVVYSPAARPDNPELMAAKKSKIKLLSYPQALGKLTEEYFTIAVSGTHGKSTTTAMAALIFVKAGLNPTVILGTKLKEFNNSNFRLGGISDFKISNERQKILIIEADEWQASFLNYRPKIIVVNNIEAEHLDYYKNLDNLLRTFHKYFLRLSGNGTLIANRDDRNVCKILSRFPSPRKISVRKFSINQKEAEKIKNILKIPGEHNVYNGLAALTVARVLKIPDRTSFRVLSEYKGAWRRFEIKQLTVNRKQLTLISDYGHHPTEVKATLLAARQKFPNKKIWCVFQPHQYQRTFYLFNDFVKVFSEAPVDLLIITDIYDVAGRERGEIKKKINSAKLVKAIKNSKSSLLHSNRLFARSIIYLSFKKIKNYLIDNLKGEEVVIIMGAGDIYNLTAEFSTHSIDN